MKHHFPLFFPYLMFYTHNNNFHRYNLYHFNWETLNFKTSLTGTRFIQLCCILCLFNCIYYVQAFSLEFSKKLNIMKLLFSFPSEIFSLKPVFAACSYAVSNSGSLHTYEQTQRKVHLVIIVAFQCLLVCMQWSRIRNCIQTSTKNRFQTKYFTGKREKNFIMFSFFGEFPPEKKLEWQSFYGTKKVMCVFGYDDCILKILHRSVNRLGHFSGVQILIVFWAFQFKHRIPGFESIMRLWQQVMCNFRCDTGFG